MEKLSASENRLAHTIDQTEFDSRYDKTAKKLLANKQILAQIMKECVNEYQDCTVEEIAEKYIEGVPEIGSIGVHTDDTNRSIKLSVGDVINGSNTEDSTLTEGTLYYDVRFDAIAPKPAGSPEPEEIIHLIINVEAQTKFYPGYPLMKRAVYYCGRMISAQHGPVFTRSDYGKLRKVYSIWICTQPPKEFENTLTRYSIQPEFMIGQAADEIENYDLLSIVMVCLGQPGAENYKGILKFMEVLLSSSRSGFEKKKILNEEFGVAMSEELEREVFEVCNLSQGIRAEGIEEGRKEGRREGRKEGRREGIGIGEIRMLVRLVQDGDLTLARAASKAKMTVEQFEKIMQTPSSQIF